MLIEQDLDQVQLVRNDMKRELSLTVSGSFNPLHAQNKLLRCEESRVSLWKPGELKRGHAFVETVGK